MKTKIVVKGLTLRGFHGVLEQERIVGNEFVYDVTIEYPFERAAMADDVSLTLSYVDVIQIIRERNAQPVKLLETLAVSIKSSLQAAFPAITGGCVSVTKSLPPIASCQVGGVSATVEW